MRPRLPDADTVLPYLRRIDAARVYSNLGPLTNELADRLGAHFDSFAVPVTNATMGLVSVLLAYDLPRGGLCLVPSWTFVASAHAILAAGLTPFLVDVDPASGALTPDIARAALAQAPGQVVAAMPVAPFGALVDPAPWLRFARDYDIAVVIDAAAGFDTVVASHLPQVVSLHATKVLGAGEAGVVLCRDGELTHRIHSATNFGFAHGKRQAIAPGVNAKLSEYQAAVALAALDQWPQARGQFASALNRLRASLADCDDLLWPQGLGERWVASTACVSVRAGGSAVPLARHCLEHGIVTRRWWEAGLHTQPAFSACPRRPLPVTDDLAGRVLGLPCWPDLDDDSIAQVARTLKNFFRRRSGFS